MTYVVLVRDKSHKEVEKMNTRIIRNDADLKEVFQSVKEEMGLEIVVGKFSALKEFKVRWKRVGTYAIDFRISDYLKNAPYEVIEDFMKGIINKIINRIDGDAIFGVAFKDYVTADEFMEKHQKTYIRRCRGFNPLIEGSALDERIQRIHKNLVDAGLVKGGERIKFIVAKEERDKLGSTVIMKVVELCPTMVTWTDRELASTLLKSFVRMGFDYPMHPLAMEDAVEDAMMQFRSMSDEELFGA